MSTDNNYPQITAYQFAEANDIPIKCHAEYMRDNLWQSLYVYDRDNYNLKACDIGIYRTNTLAAIAIRGFTCPIEKETAIWHELGHYVDLQQLGSKTLKQLPQLLHEARASMIAIILMRRHGRYIPSITKEHLLQAYDSYGNNPDFSTQQSYRHLIEEA